MFNPGLISDWKQEQPMNFTWDISKRPEYKVVFVNLLQSITSCFWYLTKPCKDIDRLLNYLLEKTLENVLSHCCDYEGWIWHGPVGPSGWGTGELLANYLDDQLQEGRGTWGRQKKENLHVLPPLVLQWQSSCCGLQLVGEVLIWQLCLHHWCWLPGTGQTLTFCNIIIV